MRELYEKAIAEQQDALRRMVKEYRKVCAEGNIDQQALRIAVLREKLAAGCGL